MIKPDDDFDDDFEADEPEVSTETIEASAPDQRQYDTRRKIEDILEARRLKEEFGELAL